MEYTAYDSIKYYKECAVLVEGLGYKLVDLKIIPAKTITKISAIVTTVNPDENMGVNDCAKVHRVLLPRLEELLGTEDTTMELTSPGIEHNIKNAAEFAVFKGRNVRVWDKEITDWIGGKIISADDKSVTMEKENGEQITELFENIAKAKFISK
ncbi:MAG: ribosome maturation factor [Spirochaetia bacterium]|nr:ribosome maturation factor [Spirochaetia bacterium]MDD7767386.1 ribosome maturation factor [Treponema sp.]